jgi:drug/metabolite transporter (DMT)-like permease
MPYPAGVLAVVCALTSALLYALASVLQQRGAAAQPADTALRLTLLTRLLRNPGWLLGLLCDIAGYVFQFVALGHGALVVVQPLLVTGLLFALPIGAAWSGRKLSRWDWIAAVMVCAGLAVFLTAAQPSNGRPDVSAYTWGLLLGSAGGLSFFLVTASLGRPAWQRAVLLSSSSGVIYGLAAALTKTSSHLFESGILHFLGHWQPYALAAAGVGGMLVAQSAFQAGSLEASLPPMTVIDPIVSILIGVIAFDESISDSGLAIALEVVSLAAMSVGVFLLARSEAVRSIREPKAPPT